MDNIVEAISKSLCSRRPELSSDPLSQWAKIGLLFPPSFEYDYIYDIYSERDDFAFHQPCFLEYHFHHLINPIDTNYWLFMTFAPRIGNRNLTLQDGFEWLNQYTYFKIEDLFTILGCLWISFSGPVTELLKSAKKRKLIGISDIFLLTNDESFIFPENSLEIISVVSVVDASHHSFERHDGKPKNTFRFR